MLFNLTEGVDGLKKIIKEKS